MTTHDHLCEGSLPDRAGVIMTGERWLPEPRPVVMNVCRCGEQFMGTVEWVKGAFRDHWNERLGDPVHGSWPEPDPDIEGNYLVRTEAPTK